MANVGTTEGVLRVAVVGAGAAGLAAARALHDAGHSVIVVEARARIGGRAWTDYGFAPHPVELGAEFIHGAQAITWDLLRRFGLGAIEDGPNAGFGIYFQNHL